MQSNHSFKQPKCDLIYETFLIVPHIGRLIQGCDAYKDVDIEATKEKNPDNNSNIIVDVREVIVQRMFSTGCVVRDVKDDVEIKINIDD